MVRVVVLYDEAPDPERYAQHIEFCKEVPGATSPRAVFGAPMGEPQHRYYAEFEWPDTESFQAAVSSPEFAATGKDAMEMGVKFGVEFARLETI